MDRSDGDIDDVTNEWTWAAAASPFSVLRFGSCPLDNPWRDNSSLEVKLASYIPS